MYELLCGVDNGIINSLWFRNQGEASEGDNMTGLCFRPPDQSEEVGKDFFK